MCVGDRVMMCMSSGSLGGASRVRKRARLFWVGQNSDHKRIHDDTFQIRSVKVLTWDFGYKVSHPLSSVKMYPVVDPEMVGVKNHSFWHSYFRARE